MDDKGLDMIEARVARHNSFQNDVFSLVAEVRRLRAALKSETQAREATRRGYEMARDYAARSRAVIDAAKAWNEARNANDEQIAHAEAAGVAASSSTLVRLLNKEQELIAALREVE